MRSPFASAGRLTLGLALGCALLSEPEGRTVRGSVERIKVHGKGLEGNLAGDSPDRDVSIFLPPSYRSGGARRYPVVYMLHGFTDDDARWYGVRPHWINLPEVIERTLAGGRAREMIVVMPNAFTAYQGSMYSNSVTTGNWEGFVARELVSYVDAHYRTIPHATSRGVAGHSMGGYGALRIGMRNPDVFSALYALSPCCLIPNLDTQDRARMEKAEAVHSIADLERADFFTKAVLASAAAWSPNPKKPPLFLDLPWRNGELQPLVRARWEANAPLAMVDQHIANLRRLRAIAFDGGSEDRNIAATIRILDRILNDYELAHRFEIYDGNHVSRVAERIEIHLLPLFSRTLSFD